MKNLLKILMFAMCTAALGQVQPTQPATGTFNGTIYANGYGGWSVPQGNNGDYSWSSNTFCTVNQGGTTFPAFTMGTPIQIIDQVTPANNEIVTVTDVNVSSNACSIATTTPTHQHTQFSLTSATAGLQEALNATLGSSFSNVVVLTADWYKLGGTQAMITQVQGNNKLGIIDQSAIPNNFYRWNGSQYVPVSIIGSYLPLGGGTLSGALFGPNINGEIYPAACGGASPPSWCSGTTADAWYRAACTQLPANGGIINELGLTGTIAASMTCSTPTKQVITLLDPTSLLTITQHDGGVVYPISNASMVVGPPGGGQCNIGGGTHLASTANVSAVFANAQTDGTQEDLTVQGVCFWGSTNGVAGTVTQGVIYVKQVFVNTTISSNFISVCPAACLRVENVGGIISIGNNEFNGTSGILTFNTSPLVIAATGSVGCSAGQINIWSTNAEHANGGANFPEVNIFGTDAGAVNCAVYINGMYTERNQAGTPSTIGIRVRDCQSCSLANIQGGGSTGGDLINISQSAAGRVQDVSLRGISNVFGSYTNTVNDTTLGAPPPLTFAAYPFVTFYSSNPGYIQPPVLPGTIPQSIGTDAMAGDGSFSTGSGTLGTNFGTSGCLSGQGFTCTYTRTNSTAPPNATFSQEVQITANTDAGSSHNGVQYAPTVSFIANKTYVATVWAKGDGTFTGRPEFLLWDPTVPVTYCDSASSSTFTTAWVPYVFYCTPSVTGSSHLSIGAVTPAGATGTFYLGEFTFNIQQPLPPGSLLTSLTAYGFGPATTQQQTIMINGVACQLVGTCTILASGVPTVNGNAGALVLNFSSGAGSCAFASSTTTCTVSGSGSGGGSVTNVIAGTLPTGLGLTVGSSTTTPTLNFTLTGIPNAALANSAITIGTTAVSLGASQTTFAGVTLTAPVFTGSWTGGTPGSLVLTNATGLPWTGLTGTPSTTQVPVQSLDATGTNCATATLVSGSLKIPPCAPSGGGAGIYIHTLSGATPVIAVNSSSAPGLDTNYIPLTANVTSTALPASTGIADGEILTIIYAQPASGGSFTIANGTAGSSLTPGSGTTLVNTIPGGCPSIGTTVSSSAPSQLIYSVIYKASLTQYQVLACQTASPAQVSVVEGSLTVVSAQYGSYAANSFLVGTKMVNSGHFTNVQVSNTSATTCGTSPSFTVVNRTQSTTGTNATVATTGSAAGVIQDTAQTLTYNAGDDVALIVSVQGASCSNFLGASAQYASP